MKSSFSLFALSHRLADANLCPLPASCLFHFRFERNLAIVKTLGLSHPSLSVHLENRKPHIPASVSVFELYELFFPIEDFIHLFGNILVWCPDCPGRNSQHCNHASSGARPQDIGGIHLCMNVSVRAQSDPSTMSRTSLLAKDCRYLLRNESTSSMKNRANDLILERSKFSRSISK